MNMMKVSNVTEKDLAERSEIKTDSGETLSWRYLCYVRDNSPEWKVPTHVLYGENDDLTSFATM